MKKFVKMAMALSMVLGLASCGNDAPTGPSWQEKTIAWFKSKGVEMNSIPGAAFTGLTPTFEITNEGKADEHLTITFITNNSSSITSQFKSEMTLNKDWGMFTYDDENQRLGEVSYSYASKFVTIGNEGVYPYIESYSLFENSYLASKGISPKVILYVALNKADTAETTEAAINQMCEIKGIQSPMVDQQHDLSEVSDYFIIEPTLGDYSNLLAKKIAVNNNLIYDEQYFDAYGQTTVNFDNLISTTSLDACNEVISFLTGLTDYDFTLVDGPNPSTMYANMYTAILDSDEYGIEVEVDSISNPTAGTARAIATFYSIDEDLSTFFDSFNIYAFDPNEKMSDKLIGVANPDNQQWTVDRSYLEDWGFDMIRSVEVDFLNMGVWNMFYTRNSFFSMSIFSNIRMTSWPYQLISDYANDGLGFTTEVPGLDSGKFMSEHITDDTFDGIVLTTFDHGDHLDEKSYEQAYYKLFKDNSDWTLKEERIRIDSMGTTRPCYIAVSTETKNYKQLEVVFYTDEYYFYVEVLTLDLPTKWHSTEINAFTKDLGFTVTVPSLRADEEIWAYYKEGEYELVTYAEDKNNQLLTEYLNVFNGLPDDWEVDQEHDDKQDIDFYNAFSKEFITEDGYEYVLMVQFFHIEDQFIIYITIIRRFSFFPVAYLNNALDAMGWGESGIRFDNSIISTFDRSFVEMKTGYDTTKDCYVVSMVYDSDNVSAINRAITSLKNYFEGCGLSGPYQIPSSNIIYYYDDEATQKIKVSITTIYEYDVQSGTSKAVGIQIDIYIYDCPAPAQD